MAATVLATFLLLTTLAVAQSNTEPCAQISFALSSYSSAYPEATEFAKLPADIALECASSASFHQEDAARLVGVLDAFLEFQSDPTYRKDPPEGFLLEPYDIWGALEDVKSQINDNAYESELEFQEALSSVFSSSHDGHCFVLLDVISVFQYTTGGPALVSISSDGQASPLVYVFGDVIYQQLVDATFEPSAVTQINGQDAEEFLLWQALNTTINLQDPDAMYNHLFYSLAQDSAGVEGAFQNNGYAYLASNITITFENGTSAVYVSQATTVQDFTDVVDGESFWQKFANGTQKMIDADSSSGSGSAQSNGARYDYKSKGLPMHTLQRRQATEPTVVSQRRNYPYPIAINGDGSISGYFLNDTGFEDVAILAINTFEPPNDNGTDFQSALRNFFTACQEQGKTHLVIDVQGNGGGTIGLGYEVFKQLFPTIDPFSPAEYRAHDQWNILSEFLTTHSEEVWEQTNNLTEFELAGGNTIADAHSLNDVSGKRFVSAEALNGPVEKYDDKFTELFRPRYMDPAYALEDPGFILTGSEGTPLPPQPFDNNNIVVLSEGYCSSTCTTLLHLLKYQGKVKSIAVGGRPTPGPMQAIGGIKGKQVAGASVIAGLVQRFYLNAGSDDLDRASKTKLPALAENGTWAGYRLFTPKKPNQSLAVNILNAIAEGDETRTPLQYVYEAADCRLWWQAAHLFDITTLWSLVASTAFGLNGIDPWSSCVEGSTGHPSSLSGDDALFSNGIPNNVTAESPASNADPTSTSGGGASSTSEAASGGDGNGASSVFGEKHIMITVGLAGLVMAAGLS